MEEILLIHRKKSLSGPKLPEILGNLGSRDWLQAETCLREMSFGLSSWVKDVELSEDVDVLRGPRAYQFCLQMACGLFSPIVGETEVFGQFRSFFSPEKISLLSWAPFAEKFSSQIFSDVKALRQIHLIGMGSQSYGSFARRYLTGAEPILVIGGGQLAQEVLPWIGKQSEQVVKVLVRRAEVAQSLEARFDHIKSSTYENFQGPAGSVVVAAPISGDQLAEFLEQHQIQADKILDLREESATDSLAHLAQSYCDLAEVFSEMEKTKKSLAPVVEALKSDIDQRVRSQIGKTSYRPFGWDDICA